MANSRPFMDFLREHRNGTTHDELSDALQELVSQVAEERKAGKLVLTLSIKPTDVGEGALIVSDDIKIVAPKHTKGASVFYVSPENNLIRQDPKQQSLPLREIANGSEPRDISRSAA